MGRPKIPGQCRIREPLDDVELAFGLFQHKFAVLGNSPGETVCTPGMPSKYFITYRQLNIYPVVKGSTMAKDAFDMLVDTVNETNRIIIKLVRQVSAHSVWIRLFSIIITGIIAALIRLWIK